MYRIFPMGLREREKAVPRRIAMDLRVGQGSKVDARTNIT